MFLKLIKPKPTPKFARPKEALSNDFAIDLMMSSGNVSKLKKGLEQLQFIKNNGTIADIDNFRNVYIYNLYNINKDSYIENLDFKNSSDYSKLIYESKIIEKLLKK